MKTKTVKGWTALLDHVPPDARVYPTQNTREFIDEVAREYKKLADKSDIMWLRSSGATTSLLDWEVVKFIFRLYRREIISDLYVPLKLEKVEGDELVIKGRKIFVSEEIALAEALKNPRDFNKNFIGFRMKNWPKFQEISREVYEKLGVSADQTKVSFDEVAGTISYRDKKCELPFKKLEYYIAKALFEKPAATKMTEDDLLKYFDLQSSRSESPSRIYDAVGRINKKARSYLGLNKLIGYKNSYYWLNNASTE